RRCAWSLRLWARYRPWRTGLRGCMKGKSWPLCRRTRLTGSGSGSGRPAYAVDPRPVEPQELDAITRRDRRRQLRAALGGLAEILIALVIGLGVGALVMRGAGYNWRLAYEGLLIGSFGDQWAIADTLASATPLILTGLVFGLSARAGYFNIGAQGQM